MYMKRQLIDDNYTFTKGLAESGAGGVWKMTRSGVGAFVWLTGMHAAVDPLGFDKIFQTPARRLPQRLRSRQPSSHTPPSHNANHQTHSPSPVTATGSSNKEPPIRANNLLLRRPPATGNNRHLCPKAARTNRSSDTTSQLGICIRAQLTPSESNLPLSCKNCAVRGYLAVPSTKPTASLQPL